MGANISIRNQENWYSDKQDWLGTLLGIDQCRSFTLDLNLFTADHCPEGYVPSGTVLGKVTASGLFGPYDPDGTDGRETAAGHLFEAVEMASGDTYKVGAALYWMGVVVEANLPLFDNTVDGELDANGKADLATFIRYE